MIYPVSSEQYRDFLDLPSQRACFVKYAPLEKYDAAQDVSF